ncbi:MAG: DUF5050 domain-containing protein, partial [Methanomassiliicoccaceae archaeon]|nr:DUF5050 domain-containing protein [Methanomassiliicoccaceae archaeon]
VTEGHIYFTKNNAKSLHRSWEDGDNQEEFPVLDKDVIHIADGGIYAADPGGMNFYRMKIDRTKMNISDMDMSQESFHSIRHVDAADGWIFYDVGGSLFRVRADGSDEEKLSDGMIEGIRKVVDDWIYYVKDGKLFRKPIS